MKSPALYVKSRKTHSVCIVTMDFKCSLEAMNFSIIPVDNTNISILSTYTINILKQIGYEAKLENIRITNTMRTSYDQARIMYENIVREGIISQYKLYGWNGDQVIKVYETNKNKEKSEVIKLMENKINELGPSRVSKHCVSDFSALNVLDIGLKYMTDTHLKNCSQVIAKYVKEGRLRFIDESDQNCFHLEIYQ